jgi:hypothetical protein
MNENDTNKKNEEFVENLKEQTTEFVTDAKEALEIAKKKIKETLTDENIEEAKKKASILAVQASKNLANFAEEAKENLNEVTQKTKTFFQKIFKK